MLQKRIAGKIVLVFSAIFLLLSGYAQAPTGEKIEPTAFEETGFIQGTPEQDKKPKLPRLEISIKQNFPKKIYRYGAFSYPFGKIVEDEGENSSLQVGWPTVDMNITRYLSYCPDGKARDNFVEEKLFANLGFIDIAEYSGAPKKLDSKPVDNFFVGNHLVIEKNENGEAKIFSKTENGKTIYFIKYKSGPTNIKSPKHYDIEGWKIVKPESRMILTKLPAIEDATLVKKLEEGTQQICS